jgi:hypothetical protein
MGVREDMNWLETGRKGWGRIFKLIAEREGVSLRKLKDSYGGGDWWPIRAYVRILVNRGLVKEEKGIITLTEEGEKVFEMVKTVEGVPSV